MGEHLKLAGEWDNISQTNLDEMLQKIGINFLKRKVAVQLKPSQAISFDENKMTVIADTPVTKGEAKVVPLDGSEFSEEMFDNTLVASATVNADGSITVKGKVCNMDLTAVRRINEAGKMILTTTLDGVECERVFIRK